MPPSPYRWLPSMAFFFCRLGNEKHLLLDSDAAHSSKMASKHGFFFCSPGNGKTSIIKQLMPPTPVRWRPSMAFFFCSPGNEKHVLLDRWCHLLPTDGVQAWLPFVAALEIENKQLNSWCRQLQQDGVQAWLSFSAALKHLLLGSLSTTFSQ